MPLVLLPPTLATAGLAPVASAALVGLLVGVPAARALRTVSANTPAPVGGVVATLVDVTVFGVLAGTLAALLAPLAVPLGVAAGFAAWTGAGWLAAREHRVRMGFGAAAAGLAILLGAWALLRGPWPVTASEPGWSLLGAVAVPALTSGLWLGGLGGGQWARPRRPGTSRAPWGTAGIVVLSTLGVVLWSAGRYERELGASGPDPALAIVVALAWLAAASTWLTRHHERRTLPVVTGGLIGTAWFAGPAVGVTGVLASAGLPLLVAGTVGFSALPLRGAERVVALVAAGLALVAGVIGLSQADLAGLGDAASFAVTVVVAFWYTATVLVRKQSEVTA